MTIKGTLTILLELKMEDTRGFVKMTRMNFEHFNEVLKAIEMDITPHQVIGEVCCSLYTNTK